MKRRYKVGGIVACVVCLMALWLLDARINTDSIFCRYFFPGDSFLILEGQNEPSLYLNVALDGERTKIYAYTPKSDPDMFYFFLPAGCIQKKIRVIDNLDHDKWKYAQEDFAVIGTQDEISAGEDICLTVTQATSGDERNYHVCMMQADSQPSVFIRMDENLDSLLADRDLKVKGSIDIYDQEADRQFSGTVKVKGHGNASWDSKEKKSWLFDFSEATSVLGMNRGYKYIAISNSLDPSYVRNKLVYDWSGEMGLRYSPNSEFANLYVNGEYLGLYLIVEGIEASEGRVNIRQDEQEAAGIRRSDLQTYNVGNEKGYISPAGMAEDENIGYLLREEVGEDRWEAVKSGFITEGGSQFEIVSPQYATQTQIANIRDYVQKIENAIADGGYQELIDTDSFVRKYLIEEISKNYDGNRRSSYYYMPSFEAERILYQGPVWDYDMSLGNPDSSSWHTPMGIVKLKPGLYEHEEFMNDVILYYTAYFRPWLETKAEERIRGYAEEIRCSVAMDQMRWNENTYWQDEFEDAIEELISFIQIRKQFLDDVWLNGKTFYRINFVDGETMIKTVYLEAGSLLGDAELPDVTADTEGRLFLGWYDESLENEMDQNAEIYENMAFWAKWE